MQNHEVSISLKDLEREQMFAQIVVERDAIIKSLSGEVQKLKTELQNLKKLSEEESNG